MRYWGLLVGVMILFIVQGPACAQEYGIVRGQLVHDGLIRTYRLFIPSQDTGENALPLVVMLHGGGGTSRQIMRYTSMNRLAEREGFFVVYPDGIRNRWNDGRVFDGADLTVDDVGFIKAIVETLIAKHHIDATRIYSAGISNGGHMSLRLACDLSDIFAAVAAVTANMPQDIIDRCNPNPIGVLIMNGTNDPILPYQGGEVRVLNQSRGVVLSTEDSVNFWLSVNGCASNRISSTFDVDHSDKTAVIMTLYDSCQTDYPVALYRIEGGGHSWPGAPQYLTEDSVGPTSRDINASEVIWAFFSSLSR